MPEDKKSVQPKPKEEKKSGAKMVPIADLLAQKSKVKKLEEELAEIKSKFNAVSAELEVAKANVEDDEEVKKVRAYLINQAKEIEEKRTQLDKDLASFKEREREVVAMELASKYEVDKDAILAGDDIEKTALSLYAERLAKEKEELTKKSEESSSSESVYESGAPSIVKKQPKDMTDEEFDAYEKRLREEALSQR